ncbi:hypothetical protein P12x_005307 [Tundrisphaera lichenicola]|uniref:hypothetical protein n=1 Tax=Tundrisphaera lichenicola TaxID=2029860 RepID=UPI003EBB6878
MSGLRDSIRRKPPQSEILLAGLALPGEGTQETQQEERIAMVTEEQLAEMERQADIYPHIGVMQYITDMRTANARIAELSSQPTDDRAESGMVKELVEALEGTVRYMEALRQAVHRPTLNAARSVLARYKATGQLVEQLQGAIDPKNDRICHYERILNAFVSVDGRCNTRGAAERIVELESAPKPPAAKQEAV